LFSYRLGTEVLKYTWC